MSDSSQLKSYSQIPDNDPEVSPRFGTRASAAGLPLYPQDGEIIREADIFTMLGDADDEFTYHLLKRQKAKPAHLGEEPGPGQTFHLSGLWAPRARP